MEKSLFYDINYGDDQRDSMIKAVKNIDRIDPSSSASDATISSEAPRQVIQGDEIMAEVDTAMLAAQHADIRKEAVENTAAVRRDVLFEGQEGVMTTKDARHDVISATENQADRVVDRVIESRDVMNNRFFDVGRDTADLKAQVVQTLSEIRLVGANTAKDTEIAVLKNTIEGEKNTRYLADKIESENDKTRALINDLKYGDLNRELIERNSLLVEERFGRRWYRDQGQFQSQFAALQQQVQAFNSQLQETRQGMVNFGTMAGVGQTSTSNNVR
jgi:hypothetical protein